MLFLKHTLLCLGKYTPGMLAVLSSWHPTWCILSLNHSHPDSSVLYEDQDLWAGECVSKRKWQVLASITVLPQATLY